MTYCGAQPPERQAGTHTCTGILRACGTLRIGAEKRIQTFLGRLLPPPRVPRREMSSPFLLQLTLLFRLMGHNISGNKKLLGSEQTESLTD